MSCAYITCYWAVQTNQNVWKQRPTLFLQHTHYCRLYFYRAIPHRALYCHGKLSVRPSVPQSVYDVEEPRSYKRKRFRLVPQSMTLHDLWARVKVINYLLSASDSAGLSPTLCALQIYLLTYLNAPKMAKYSLVMTPTHICRQIRNENRSGRQELRRLTSCSAKITEMR